MEGCFFDLLKGNLKVWFGARTSEGYPPNPRSSNVVVGNGFFTMKHRFQCLRDQLQKIYMEFDSFAMFRIVFDEIDRLNSAYHNNFFDFNRHNPAKRVT